MELYSLVRILAFVHVALNRGEARHHSAEIIQRPDDVIGADCGKEIRVTCMARSRDEPKITRPTPDIEWWFKEQQESMTSQSRKIHRLDREERVKILVEVFTVVKSTLIIKDAQPGDEGVYQCRASNSPNRYKEGVNLYQHWKIEEAPVTNMKCGEATTIATTFADVAPTSSYNRSVISDVINLAMTSIPNIKKSNDIYEKQEPETPNRRKVRPIINRPPRRSTAPNNTTGRGTGSTFHQSLHVLLSSLIFLSCIVTL
uniref:uncharacterized protein LOC100186625 isoform X1 n=1 Tax=Ciona intestinalis TaxID=7719 RepID=UPI00089DA886|nr:uncharacterized protein LOC100186625 isoform X1 [Ciona intestinalis]|eukprot:XP_018667431.1 uncharacterized protein LOC100186625 isoform X1 [Ciona intestinalis]